MSQVNKVRIDKWLWAVRVFKSRSMAGRACTAGKVMVNDVKVKAAFPVSEGELVRVKKGQELIIYKVIKLIEKRVSAPLAAECFEDNSPPPIPRKFRPGAAFLAMPDAHRAPGAGRPTKKERRELDSWRDDIEDVFEEE